MEIRAIDYFLAVAAAGSLTAAAKNLTMSQPALTKAISRLEDEVGSSLFTRGARGVTLTPFGRSFLRHAQTVHSTMADAYDELEALREGRAGMVRIGAGPTWMLEIVPRAVRQFRQQFPDVLIQVLGGLDDVLRAALREVPLDCVLAAIPEGAEEPDLAFVPLLTDEYQVVAGRDHPLRGKAVVKLRDLLDYPWILPAPTTYMTRRLQTMFRAAGLRPPRAAIETSEDTRFKAEIMAADGGPHYLSFHAVGHLLAEAPGSIAPLPVTGASWQRKAGIVVRKGLPVNPPADEFLKIVRALCAVHQTRL